MKKSLLPLLFILLCGCSSDPKPDGIIDTATMTAFLTEAHLIESYDFIAVQPHRDSLAPRTAAATDSLLNKYGITAADYDSSLSYYLLHPKILEDIYSRVVNNLRDIANAAPELPQVTPDSTTTTRQALKPDLHKKDNNE